MALVVEDGTGVVAANSYASVEDADAYFADRGNNTWAAAQTDDKSSALISATDYIESQGQGRWIGVKEFPETPQALSFPRIHMQSWQLGPVPDGVPVGITKATYEYAVRWLADRTLAPDPTFDDSGRLPSMTLQKVGPITDEAQFDTAKGSSLWLFRPYPLADALIAPYKLSGGGGVIRN